MRVLPVYLAAAALILFVAGVLRDPRSFSNAVLLGSGLALAALAAAHRLAEATGPVARLLALALGLLVAFGPVLVASYLVLNGITMVRREGIRPANLLSLLAGLGIFGLLGLMIATFLARSPDLTVSFVIIALLSGYISFLLVSYVIYAFVYSRITGLRRADFVVVLGAGLNDGDRVPPLLASRLERARRVYQTLAGRRGTSPVLIVSGGQGSDERVSEAEAMAGYLIGRGIPEDHVVREDQSRTTEENLTFSQAIMDRSRPGYRCIIVTSNYHVFRTAIVARRLGVNGQVTGARTAGYYWPSAMLREFAAVFLSYKTVNFGICALIVALPLALYVVSEMRRRCHGLSRARETPAGAGRLHRSERAELPRHSRARPVPARRTHAANGRPAALRRRRQLVGHPLPPTSRGITRSCTRRCSTGSAAPSPSRPPTTPTPRSRRRPAPRSHPRPAPRSRPGPTD